MGNRGGTRAGAGRKPLYKSGCMDTISVTLRRSDVEFLKSYGDDNVSRGIRRLVIRQGKKLA